MRKTITIGGRQFKLKKEVDELLDAVWTFGDYSLTCRECDGGFTYIIESPDFTESTLYLVVQSKTEPQARKKLNTLLAGGWLGMKWT